MDKSSLKFFKIAMEKSLEWTSRKNLHISNEKSPWINLFFSNLQDNFSKKKKKSQIFKEKSLVNKSYRKNLQWTNLH